VNWPRHLGITRVVILRLASVFLALGLLFAIVEAAFQISKAIHVRSMAARAAEQSWIVYDQDLVYRPRILPSPGPKRGVFRVVMLGDSLIGGSKEGSMVGRLETIANRDSDLAPTEWVNTSVVGYTNYQELVYLKKFGLGLEPDLVGVAFCLNDVHKFLHNLKVVNGRLAPDTFWDTTPEAVDSARGWLLAVARHSLFLRWIRSHAPLAARTVEMYEHGGYDFDYRPDFSTAWQDSAWTIIHDQMAEMAVLSKAKHFGLFLVVVPFGEQYRKDYLARDSNYVVKPQRILGALMASLKIPYLDLYPDLDKDCFQPDRIHLTDDGKQRAAEKIAAFLKNQGLLPVRGKPE